MQRPLGLSSLPAMSGAGRQPLALRARLARARRQAAGASSAAGGAKAVPAARAEALLRRLLPGLPALRFQHLMRVVRHELFCTLDPAGEGRCGPRFPARPIMAVSRH